MNTISRLVFLLQWEFLVGLREDAPPPGYRPLTRDDLMDATLRTRLVAEHQARGGWGLAKDPLRFNGVLAVVEGRVQINRHNLGMVRQDLWESFTARDMFYSVMDWVTNVPWNKTPPTPDDTWSVEVCNPGPLRPCLLVRDVALASSALI